MLVCFPLLAFVFIDYFTPDWQKDVQDISRQVVAALFEADDRRFLNIAVPPTKHGKPPSFVYHIPECLTFFRALRNRCFFSFLVALGNPLLHHPHSHATAFHSFLSCLSSATRSCWFLLSFLSSYSILAVAFCLILLLFSLVVI